jgi:hypothetical protein
MTLILPPCALLLLISRSNTEVPHNPDDHPVQICLMVCHDDQVLGKVQTYRSISCGIQGNEGREGEGCMCVRGGGYGYAGRTESSEYDDHYRPMFRSATAFWRLSNQLTKHPEHLFSTPDPPFEYATEPASLPKDLHKHTSRVEPGLNSQYGNAS